MASPATVLIVDDEPDICETLSDYLAGRGYAVETRSSAEAGEERLAAGGVDALVLDLKLPGRDGLALLEAVRARDPELCVLIITGYATADSAIEALRKSADDYLEKPFNYDVLARALARALERRRLRRSNRRLVVRLRRANQKLGRRGQMLRERVAEATRNLRFLLDLARELGRDLDLGETLDGVAERARALTHARAALVFLRVPGSDCYELEASSPADLAAPDLAHRVGEGLAGRAALVSRPLRHRIGEGPLAPGDPLARLGPASALAVPMLGESGAIGTLVVLDRAPEGAGADGAGPAEGTAADFGDEDEELALGFSAHAAVAIRNAQIYAEARRLDRLQSEFVAAVSHELRTPLTQIKASLEILDTRTSLGLDPDAHRFLSIGDDAVRQLEDQIELILASAEIETDELALDLVEVAAGELAAEAARRLRPVAARKRIPIEVVLPETPATVRVDRPRFVRALSNLLSNAVKFSDSGEEVRLEVEAADGLVSFHVIDRGIGIDPGDQSLIFRRFAQLDGSLTRRAGGTGLGLSVSRALVERHGGRILVRSRPGEGSRFTVEIPAAAASAHGEDRLASAA